jgi:molybdopterin synthase sulfur carrier subunit
VTDGDVVEVRLPGLLAADADGKTVHRVPADGVRTVADLLDALASGHPRLDRRLRDETGTLRRYVNVFVGQEDVRRLNGLATPVRPGDVVLVLPSVAGG